ncbi:MAG: recombinase family protein [Oscillospiraceae bacterium]|nr:recombinase family protein [Oscillospiraceae bacterium]
MKVAIYCRLSDEDRDKLHENDDSASIQNQKAMLAEYASDNGWTIYDIYSDDDYAGSDRCRPAFNRLIQDARAGLFDIVLCKTQSRFTRELELVETYIHDLFPRLGIRFVSIVDNADTDNTGNKKSRQITGLVNEWFLEDLSDNIKSVLTSRRKKGLHIGSFAPYGYMKDPDQKGHLLIDPEAASVVRTIFTLYAEGHGKQAIARILNQKGIPTPTEYKRLHGMVRNRNTPVRTLWGYTTISQTLTNEVYIGNMVQGKAAVASYKSRQKIHLPRDQWITVPGTHMPIIDRQLWDNVQSLIRKKAATTGTGQPGIFSGKIRCMHCGYRMCSTKNGQKRGYKCKTHSVSADACIGASISLPKLERIVAAELQALSEALLDQEALENGIDLYPDLRATRARLESEIALYRRRSKDLTAGLRGLYMDKIKKIITESEFQNLSAAFRADQEKMSRQIIQCREKIARIDITLGGMIDRKLLVRRYAGTRHLTKEMTDILIDHILVGKRDPVSKTTPVEIHWQF